MIELATPLFYPARPQFSLDGNVEAMLSATALTLAVEESVEGFYGCEATFLNWGKSGNDVGFTHFDRRTLDFGRTLNVEIGDGEAGGEVFTGRISAIEGRFPAGRAPEILILAEDRLQDLRMTRRTRTFEDSSVADVLQDIAQAHGLNTDIDLDGPTFRVLAQLNQSDLAFLRERVYALDGELWIDNDTIYAVERGRRSGGEISLAYGERLQQFVVTADLAEQRTKVTVGGWDVDAKQAIVEEAAQSAIQSELDGLDSGASILRAKFAERSEQIAHAIPMSTAEASALANAHFRRLSRRFVRGQGVAEGDARIRVGATVNLDQLGPLFSGRYYTTEVKHVFDSKDGYRTYFSVERPGLGNA